MATNVEFETVAGGFPTKGIDEDIVKLGTAAMKDGQVRKGPDNADTRKLLAALRSFADSQDRKLKTRTVGSSVYWQILNEAPKRRENGAANGRK